VSKAADTFAETLIARMEEGNLPPWRKTWRADTSMPRNAKSGRAYRGMNVWILALTSMSKGYADPRWMTFNQARDLGGMVRKGEKGSAVAFFQPPERDDEGNVEKAPFWKTFHVFNVEQIDGLTLAPLAQDETPRDPLEACEAVIAGMPNPPVIRQIAGAQACYHPVQDAITTARMADFESVEAFYVTLFHEVGHSTGAEKRLNRDGVTDRIHFGSDRYGREELVAEMTSAMLAAETGIDAPTVENTAAYLASWIRTIREDPSILLQAAGQAQRAVDYVLDRKPASA